MGESFVRRHFGTDALVGGWLFVVGSVGYLVVAGLLALSEMHDHDVPRVVTVWVNFAAAGLFLMGSIYFVKLSYPETMEALQAEALKCDVSRLTVWERWVTFNEMLLALWFFFLAASLYDVTGIFWLAHGDVAAGLFWIGGTTACQLALWLWAYSGTPMSIQANGGRGSSKVFDLVCCGSESPFLRSYFGTDMLFGAWLFFFGCLGATIVSVGPVVVAPGDASAWVLLASFLCFSLGSYLYVRAMREETAGTSLLFGEVVAPLNVDKTPLLARQYGAASETRRPGV